jgi:hypothetical protein
MRGELSSIICGGEISETLNGKRGEIPRPGRKRKSTRGCSRLGASVTQLEWLIKPNELFQYRQELRQC